MISVQPMQFTRLGNFAVVTRVTGPTHHYLGLRLSQGVDQGVPEVEELASSSPNDTIGPMPDQAQVVEEVLVGLDNANGRLGTDYKVKAIRYRSSDPVIKGVYTLLTESLVDHIDQSNREADGDAPPLDDETLAQIADQSFQEYDVREAADGRI
jgi:hypothetical protein